MFLCVLLSLPCHGVGMCSVDPSCCCLYCCCSAWDLWSSACLRSCRRGPSSSQLLGGVPCFLSPVFPPMLIWEVKGGIFLIPCLRPSGPHLARKGLGETGGHGPLPAWSLLFVSWRWSPIYGQTSPVFSQERREEEEMIQQNSNIFCSDGEKSNKTPQVIRRWKWGRISICGAFPYPELKLLWFWVIATNQSSNKGDVYLFFFPRHIWDIEKETFSHLQCPRKRMRKGVVQKWPI